MPREIELKWFRKLKLATESTTTKGTHVLIELRTKGYPASTKSRQTTPHKINAMTWLLLNADIHDPIARKLPAINQLPI